SRSFRCPMRLPQRIGTVDGADGSACWSVTSLEGLPDLAQRALLHRAFEAVDVELPVEVADLVLDEAGDDPFAGQLDLLALEVRAHAAGKGGAGAREEEPGHGEAALVVVLQLLGKLDDDGVEDVPELTGLDEVPGEGALADADLVRGHARAGGVVH